MTEGIILVKKAKLLEEQNKLDEASNLYYLSINQKMWGWTSFYQFCRRHKIKDHRLLEDFDRNLKRIYQLKDATEITSSLLFLYDRRAEVYDFLGMKAEAEKDRQTRKELLEKI